MDSKMSYEDEALQKSSSRDKLFHRSESVPQVTKRIVEMLDLIEQRVELLREHAAGVESEKESLMTMLSSIKSNKDLEYASEGEREEIELTVERLLNRTLTVEVSITTPRDEMQQQALNKVNAHLEQLLVDAETDPEEAKQTLQSYINACLSESKGPVHQKFQSAILECTAYDQKQIRKKLESLMSMHEH